MANCLGTIVTFLGLDTKYVRKKCRTKDGTGALWQGKKRSLRGVLGGLVSQTSKRVTKSFCGWSQGVSSVTALICDRRLRQKEENRSSALLYMRDLQRDLSQDHRWSIFKSTRRYLYPVRFHENTTLKGDDASNYRNAEVIKMPIWLIMVITEIQYVGTTASVMLLSLNSLVNNTVILQNFINLSCICEKLQIQITEKRLQINKKTWILREKFFGGRPICRKIWFFY